MQLPQKPTPRVFSGMQPSGSLHLGNYLGAMVQWVAMQTTHECIYCVVDMHAITVAQDPKELRQSIRAVTAAYMAAGVDPNKRSSSIRARCTSMRSSPGCSTASPASAGSTA